MSLIVQLAVKSPANKDVYEAIANFISRDAESFAKPDVFVAVLHHALDNIKESGVMLKCLAMLINCDEGKVLAESSKLFVILTSILLNAEKNEETLTYAIMALKNCMLNWKNFENTCIPWEQLVKLMINASFTKQNNLLQECSLQALRIMSDKASVKDKLRKVYKIKIREIRCLSDESQKLKDDLLQWLSYRNYKQSDSKYSNLFI